jgi:hypothetical protein
MLSEGGACSNFEEMFFFDFSKLIKFSKDCEGSLGPKQGWNIWAAFLQGNTSDNQAGGRCCFDSASALLC